MIHTLLLEPYVMPTIVPIEVTILRGVRKLRFSRTLRTKYNDFAPKIWTVLTRLGYKKFLQRIYVTIESEMLLKGTFYQFPILLAVLEALELIPNQTNLLTLGRLNEYQEVIPPLNDSSLPQISDFRLYLPTGKQFGKELNRLINADFTTVSSVDTVYSPELVTLLLPECKFSNGGINLSQTAVEFLKKIPTAMVNRLQFFSETALLSAQKLSLLRELLSSTERITIVNTKKETAIIAVSLFLKHLQSADTKSHK